VNEHLLWNLFSRFLVISLAAFGGGKAALPLIERISVAAGWVSPQTFAASVGFGYVAPGPVLILATFIGYQAAGVPGAVAATVGVFLAPTLLAGWAAAGVERLAENRCLRAFGAGAAPAVVGLFGATAWSLARASVTSWPLAVVAAVALVLASRTKIAPAWLLLVGSAVGWGIATQK